MRLSILGLWLVELALFFAAWMLFVDEAEFYEMLAGVAVAGVAVLGTELFRTRQKIQAALPPGWLLALGTAVWNALTETIQLLARPRLKGRFINVPFASPDRGPRGAARRALAIFLVSISANSIVVGIDRRRGLLLLHQAAPAPAPTLIGKLEGK